MGQRPFLLNTIQHFPAGVNIKKFLSGEGGTLILQVPVTAGECPPGPGKTQALAGSRAFAKQGLYFVLPENSPLLAGEESKEPEDTEDEA